MNLLKLSLIYLTLINLCFFTYSKSIPLLKSRLDSNKSAYFVIVGLTVYFSLILFFIYNSQRTTINKLQLDLKRLRHTADRLITQDEIIENSATDFVNHRLINPRNLTPAQLKLSLFAHIITYTPVRFNIGSTRSLYDLAERACGYVITSPNPDCLTELQRRIIVRGIAIELEIQIRALNQVIRAPPPSVDPDRLIELSDMVNLYIVKKHQISYYFELCVDPAGLVT